MAHKQHQPAKPSPEMQALSAKEALLGSEAKPGKIQLFIQSHPWETVGAAAVGGFLVTALKPGRTMLRQALMFGLSVGLRRIIVKYLSP